MLTAATSTFSSTVSSENSRTVWNVRPIPARATRWAFILVMSTPSMVTAPLVAGSSPVTTLISVVLPDPLGPMRPRISPVLTVKLTSSRAFRPANDLERCETSRTLPAPASLGCIQFSGFSSWRHVQVHIARRESP